MKNLLMVDSDELTLTVLEAMISMRFKDVCVLTAGNDQKGLHILASARVDFILTNLQIPFGDGHELAEYRQWRCPHIPLLAMVKDPAPAMEAKLLELGVHQWITKPFDINEVAERVSQGMQIERWTPACRKGTGRAGSAHAKRRFLLTHHIRAGLGKWGAEKWGAQFK